MDRFLTFPLLVLMEQAYTVKNIVRVTANGLGGVHFDKLKGETETRLLEHMGTVVFDAFHADLSEVTSATRQIARATSVACRPLAEMATARTEL